MQVTHKKIHTLARGIPAFTNAVPTAGEHEKLKILVGLNQRVYDLICGGRIHVGIQFTHGQQ